ncbi:hypothetical protein NEIPOLOT_00949 [Neisseria polysaccharea ATCC 43768]|nr:hypothetical protein NEIPOLOT_00949 [Neisseria polysaccharea ATCC 43768]
MLHNIWLPIIFSYGSNKNSKLILMINTCISIFYFLYFTLIVRFM